MNTGHTRVTDPIILRTAGEAARDVLVAHPHPRSSKWRALREKHVKDHPRCAACGGTDHLNVHHVRPFHIYPELELDPANLITLCEDGPASMNCHLLIGHCGSWEDHNRESVEDARHMLDMLAGKVEG